jgi:hypothetical protein
MNSADRIGWNRACMDSASIAAKRGGRRNRTEPVGPRQGGQASPQTDKLHADNADDHRRCRRACLRRGIKHRWVIERTFAWINRFRRLAIRYECRLDIHHGLTAFACSLICLNSLQGRFRKAL